MTYTPDASNPNERANAQQRQRRRAQRALEMQENKLARDLITPEGAALKLKLASAGERAGAFIIDFILILLVFFLSLWGFAAVASSFGLRGEQIVGALAMLFYFLLRNFYFVLFEMGKRAATPGKRLLGLRVAARNGGRLTANAVFARNFIREIEAYWPIFLLLFISFSEQGISWWLNLMILIWSGTFLLFPLFNADKLRAGDILAGTWVIHAPKVKLLGDISSAAETELARKERAGFNFTSAQVQAYGIHELHVLENVLRKSSSEIKSSVAERIRGKIGWRRGPGESDRAFLEAYYAALRGHLEQKLLLGTRKTDKFDKG